MMCIEETKSTGYMFDWGQLTNFNKSIDPWDHQDHLAVDSCTYLYKQKWKLNKVFVEIKQEDMAYYFSLPKLIV